MKKLIAVFLVIIVSLVTNVSAHEDTCGRCHDLSGMDFDTSIHKTMSGIDTGFKQTSGKDFNIDTPEICFECHADDCSVCHPVHKQIPEMDDCNECHKRLIGANYMGYLGDLERKAPYPDVHYQAGFDCLDCHNEDKIHGDGNSYTFAEEAVEITCEECHLTEKIVNGKKANYDPGTDAHRLHGDIQCSSCHAKYYQTCYNCHLETGEIDGVSTEEFYLMEYDGKVHPAYIQTVSYGDKISKGAGAISPHTITKDARKCEECHDNQERVFLSGYDGRIFGPPGIATADPPSKLAIDLSYIGIDFELDITLLGSLIILGVFGGIAVHWIFRKITLGRWIG